MIQFILRRPGACLFLTSLITATLAQPYCLFLPPGGAYRHGLHQVHQGQSFANTPSLEEVVWLDDGRVAAGYTGYSSFYPKRGAIRIFGKVSSKVIYQDAIEPPASANSFSQFARRLATSGNWIASPFVLTNDTSGVAVYEATGPTSWQFRTTLQADAPEPDDEFGADLAMDEDWLAILDHGDPGGIYMFHLNDEGEWQKAQILDLPGSSGEIPFRNLVLDMDEDWLVVGQRSGASSAFAGSVHVWRRNGSTWEFDDTIVPADAAAGDRFGYSVDLDGDTIVAGAVEHDEGAEAQGAVYMFQHENGEWTQTAKLTTPEIAEDTLFGYYVSYSPEGPFLGVSSIRQFHLFSLEGADWVELGQNGGGNAFYNWESPAGTVKNYVIGRTNLRANFPTQRGNQTIADFSGSIRLLEYGLHRVTTKHISNSVSACIYEPTGYAGNGNAYPGSGDDDEDRMSDLEETYYGTLLDVSNTLSAGVSAAKLEDGAFSLQWPHLPDPNLPIDAVPQWSTDLINWSSEGITVTKIGEEPGTGREILQATVPNSPEGLLFFRLQFSFADD